MPGTYYAEVESLTRQMVAIPSVVNSPGEAEIVSWIYDRLAVQPYYKEHPENLRLIPTVNDNVPRSNLIALVKSGTGKTDTVIMMGHIDTVGVEEFGELRDLAYSPERLEKVLRTEGLSEEVQQDLTSGEWMFGRGSVDMKSGVAAQMAVFTRFAANPRELEGNLLLLVTPDEEDMSHGILSALPQLAALAAEEGLNYVAVLNSDYTCARYPGDTGAYVYLGTAGKLLPSFYIIGKETHAGDCFAGLDPNLIAAELTRLIDFNPELCDISFGEVSVPPVSLKQSDLKEVYDVRTPLAAYTYYNFFTHQHTPEDVLQLMIEKGKQTVDNVLEYLNTAYARYCTLSHLPTGKLPWQIEVFSYQDFFRQIAEIRGKPFLEAMETKAAELLIDPSLDLRKFSVKMIEAVWQWSQRKAPAIITYFSSAYSPRVALDPAAKNIQRLMKSLEDATQKVQGTTKKAIAIRNYYPYISDMSYIGSCDLAGIDCLTANMPAYGSKYLIDPELLSQLNVPVVNIGPFGADAHKVTERVYKPYSFETLPLLLEATIHRLWAE